MPHGFPSWTILALAATLTVAALPALAAGTWRVGAPMPTARGELAVTELDGLIYAAGGLVRRQTTAAFERYDPAADRWQRLADLPLPLHHLGMDALGGRIYVTGGYSGGFSADYAATWAYDPASDRWTRLANMPGARAAHAMVALDGRLYVVGGVGAASSELWVYDPAADSWASAPAPLPTRREHLAAVALDGRLAVVAGRWRRANLSLIEIYDPARGTWTRARDMPTPRGGLVASVVAGRVHVTGGEAFSPRQTFAQHEVYDPATNSWSAEPDLPSARHGLGSATVGGRWYVIGGGRQAGFAISDLVEIFTPE